MTDPDHTKSPSKVKKSDFHLLLKEFSKRGVFVPRTFIDLTGDTQVASFLSQVLYWSDRTADPDGWFSKSYKQWKDEIGLSKFQVSRCASKLKPLGLETRVKKVGKAPTVHYRIDHDTFEAKYREHLDSQETGKSRNLTIQSPSDSQVSGKSSFSIIDSEETSLSSYIEYEHRIQDSLAREKELLAKIDELNKRIAVLEEQLQKRNQPPYESAKPVSNVKKEPASRPRDPLFDLLALEVFGLEEVNGNGGKVAGFRTELFKFVFGTKDPPSEKIAALTADLTGMWNTWTKRHPNLSKPAKMEAIGRGLKEYRDSLKSCDEKYEPSLSMPGIFVLKGSQS